MKEYTIEDNIPLKPREKSGSAITVLRQMEIGQSVKINGHKSRQSWYKAAKTLGIQIAIRTEGDDDRVWLVKSE